MITGFFKVALLIKDNRRTFILWFLVGVLTATIDNLAFGLFFGTLGIAISNVLSGLVAFILNFGLNHRIVFRSKSSALANVKRFVLSFAFERCVNTVQLYLWILIGLEHSEAKLIATLIQAPLSYFLNLLFVFKDSRIGTRTA